MIEGNGAFRLVAAPAVAATSAPIAAAIAAEAAAKVAAKVAAPAAATCLAKVGRTNVLLWRPIAKPLDDNRREKNQDDDPDGMVARIHDPIIALGRFQIEAGSLSGGLRPIASAFEHKFE